MTKNETRNTQRSIRRTGYDLIISYTDYSTSNRGCEHDCETVDLYRKRLTLIKTAKGPVLFLDYSKNPQRFAGKFIGQIKCASRAG